MGLKFSNWNKPTPITPRMVGVLLASLSGAIAGISAFNNYPIVSAIAGVLGVLSLIIQQFYGYKSTNEVPSGCDCDSGSCPKCK